MFKDEILEDNNKCNLGSFFFNVLSETVEALKVSI